jgi:hypothetical protein
MPVLPPKQQVWVGGSWSEAGPGKNWRPYPINKAKKELGVWLKW